MSREAILKEVWDTITVDHVVDAHLHKLRKKFPPRPVQPDPKHPGQGLPVHRVERTRKSLGAEPERAIKPGSRRQLESLGGPQDGPDAHRGDVAARVSGRLRMGPLELAGPGASRPPRDRDAHRGPLRLELRGARRVPRAARHMPSGEAPSRASAKRHLRRAAKVCPSPAGRNLSTHSLRHTTAVHLLESGVEANVIKAWLGHASISATSRYLDTTLAHKRRVLERFGPPGNVASSIEPVSHASSKEILGWLDDL